MRIAVTLSTEAQLLEAIDQKLGLVSRSRYVEQLVQDSTVNTGVASS